MPSNNSDRPKKERSSRVRNVPTEQATNLYASWGFAPQQQQNTSDDYGGYSHHYSQHNQQQQRQETASHGHSNTIELVLPKPKSRVSAHQNDDDDDYSTHNRHTQQQQQQQPKPTHHQRKNRAEEQRERQLLLEQQERQRKIEEEAERKRQIAENAKKKEEEKKSHKQQQATLEQKTKLEKKLRGAVKGGNYDAAINFCNEVFALEGRKFTNLLARDQLKQLADSISSSAAEEQDEFSPKNWEALCKATAVYSMAINKCDTSSDEDCGVLTELLSSRSWCHNELGNFDLARQDAEQVCEMYPEWSEGFLRKALACEGENDIAEAYKNFAKCLELKKNANDDDTEFVDGKILGLRGKLNDARNAAFAEGNAQLQKKHFKAALDRFDRALKCDVSGSITPEILARRSLCLIETGKDGEALETAEAAIARQPLNPLHHYRAAEACEKIPDLDKAQKHISKALELVFNAEDEELTKNIQELNTRIEIALVKRNAPSLKPEQLFNEGTRLLKQQNEISTEAAVFFFTRVLEQQSSSNSDLTTRALLSRSKCYSLLKKFKESLSDATRCLEFKPSTIDRKEIIQRQYVAAANGGDWTRAVKYCEDYLELDPKSKEMRSEKTYAESMCPILQKKRREEQAVLRKQRRAEHKRNKNEKDRIQEEIQQKKEEREREEARRFHRREHEKMLRERQRLYGHSYHSGGGGGRFGGGGYHDGPESVLGELFARVMMGRMMGGGGGRRGYYDDDDDDDYYYDDDEDEEYYDDDDESDEDDYYYKKNTKSNNTTHNKKSGEKKSDGNKSSYCYEVDDDEEVDHHTHHNKTGNHHQSSGKKAEQPSQPSAAAAMSKKDDEDKKNKIYWEID